MANGRRQPLLIPGGFMGNAQQTPAVQALLSKRAPTTRRKKRTTKKKAAKKRPAKKRVARRAAPKGRLVKGSAAAKRRMAQLRKMRKR